LLQHGFQIGVVTGTVINVSPDQRSGFVNQHDSSLLQSVALSPALSMSRQQYFQVSSDRPRTDAEFSFQIENAEAVQCGIGVEVEIYVKGTAELFGLRHRSVSDADDRNSIALDFFGD
jgi:hypothetical protein